MYEVEDIGKLYKEIFNGKGNLKILKGAQGNEENIKYYLPRSNIAHFATHGFFNPGIWKSLKEEIEKEMKKKGKKE